MARTDSTSRSRFAQAFSCSFHPALAAQADFSLPSGLSGPAISIYGHYVRSDYGPRYRLGIIPGQWPISRFPFTYPTAEQEKNQPVLCRPNPCLVSMQGAVYGNGAGKSP